MNSISYEDYSSKFYNTDQKGHLSINIDAVETRDQAQVVIQKAEPVIKSERVKVILITVGIVLGVATLAATAFVLSKLAMVVLFNIFEPWSIAELVGVSILSAVAEAVVYGGFALIGYGFFSKFTQMRKEHKGYADNLSHQVNFIKYNQNNFQSNKGE